MRALALSTILLLVPCNGHNDSGVRSAAGPNARRRDAGDAVAIVEERQRSRRSRAARTRRAPAHCGRSLRCGSGPIATASVPSPRLDLARKPQARHYRYSRYGALASAASARAASGGDPDYDGAIAIAERAIRAAPGDGALWRSLGEAYGAKALTAPVLSQLRWARKCRRAFEKAVSVAPTDVDSRIDLFTFYLEAPGVAGGGVERARRQAEEIVRLDPARGHAMLGTLFLRQRDFSRAEIECRIAIDEASDDDVARADAEWRLALLYEKLGRRSDAISALRDALKLDPEHSDAKKDLKRLGG